MPLSCHTSIPINHALANVHTFYCIELGMIKFTKMPINLNLFTSISSISLFPKIKMATALRFFCVRDVNKNAEITTILLSKGDSFCCFCRCFIVRVIFPASPGRLRISHLLPWWINSRRHGRCATRNSNKNSFLQSHQRPESFSEH